MDKGNVCGRCPQAAYGDGVRNVAFEALAKLQTLPCRYKRNDCKEILKWEQVQTHEETCIHRKHTCPTIGQHCEWTGKKGDLQNHYKNVHSQMVYSKDTPININLKTDLMQNYFVTSMDKLFFLHINFHSNLRKLWYGLFYYDTPDEKSNYSFKIELVSTAGNSLIFKAGSQHCFAPNSLKLSPTVLYEIDLNGLQLFVNNTNFVMCHVHIAMEE